jgi:hypothetical protein
MSYAGCTPDSHASCGSSHEHEDDPRMYVCPYLDSLSLARVISTTKLGTGAEGEDAETVAGARLIRC